MNFTKEVQLADVSFYQKDINWETMRKKSPAVIIRAGQNTWVDKRLLLK